MNVLLEENVIEEMNCAENYTYVLKDNSQFNLTEYKVLQNQKNDVFLKCMKMLYNGKIQLYYLTKSYKSLNSLVPDLEPEGFMQLMTNLLNNILSVRRNGFLSCKNIDISLEHIFVEPGTNKVALLYLPAKVHFFQDDGMFENELRTKLKKLISDKPELESEETDKFVKNLSNGLMSFDELIVATSGKIISSAHGGKKTETGKVKLVTINSSSRIEIEITKNEFVLGKKVGQVDGVLDFNKMISRVHCKINCGSNGYSITDLQSANGTYVNMRRLNPNQPYPIKNGDVVRLANSDFQLVIG